MSNYLKAITILFWLSVTPSLLSGEITLLDQGNSEGWRQAGSGKFTIKDGVASSSGGMGLFWYSKKKFKDCTIKLKFKMDDINHNSGIFVLFPNPGNDPSIAIKQGYEIQINKDTPGKTSTGSIYNIQAAKSIPLKKNDWNDYAITCLDGWIVIKLNGTIVNVFQGDRGKDGFIGLQNHDGNSKVHFKEIRVIEHENPDEVFFGSELTTIREINNPSQPWYYKMESPLVTGATFIPQNNNYANKGLTVSVGGEFTPYAVTFDSDLLRVASINYSKILLTGTPYDGRHRGNLVQRDNPIISTKAELGWALNGSFTDTRAIPHGPIADEQGLYKGLYRSGNRIVFNYSIGSTDVLENFKTEIIEDEKVLIRTINLAKRSEALSFSIADLTEGGLLSSNEKIFSTNLSKVDPDTFIQLSDSKTTRWTDLLQNPSDTDYGQKAIFTYDKSQSSPNINSNGTLPRLNDGTVGSTDDDTQNSTWFDGPSASILVDLKAVIALRRVNVYSWHRNDRSPQKYTLYGAKEQNGKWSRIAQVDKGLKGYKNLSIISGKLGDFRYLKFALKPSGKENFGTFFQEIDIYSDQDEIPVLKKTDSLSIALCGSGVKMQKINDKLVGIIPAGDPLNLKVMIKQGEKPFTNSALATSIEQLAPLTKGGRSNYPEEITVKGLIAPNSSAYVVDDIPVPFVNPWQSNMRIGGFDFFKDGQTAACCTWNGDVFLIKNIKGDWQNIRWKRIATGLYETLGLKIVDETIYVHGRDQISRLHDLNGDEEIDFYENFNNDITTTANFHEFAFDLQTDKQGNFYFAKAAPVKGGGRGFDKIVPHNGTVLKLSKDGKNLEVYSTGLRAPNGIGVGPNGEVTAGDNEGTWVPHCKIHWLKKGSFQGVKDTAHSGQDTSTYNKPLCWLPMNVDNSGGSQVWVDSDKWGPFNGDLLHLSYGRSSIYKVMKEEVNGQIQGGVVRIPVTLGSSAMRARFNPLDNQLYVSGLRGWQTNAARNSAIQRIRYTGKEVNLPVNMSVTKKGVEIEFTCELDKELAEDIQSYSISWWNYVWGPMYGSGEFSVDTPDKAAENKALLRESKSHVKHDKVVVKSAKLSKDKKKVFLEIDMKEVMQMHIKFDLETIKGEPVISEIFNTVNALK